MDFVRIGDKLVSREKLYRAVDRILALRSAGLSQQEAANQIGVDRTFVSRLETLGEVRKGGRMAVIGFPLENKGELEDVCKKLGVDYALLMTDEERWHFVESVNGLALMNNLMKIIANLQDFETVVMIGSDMRIRLAEALFGDAVIGVEIGESPIKQDVYYRPEDLTRLILEIKGGN
ncbi:MAG: helix-turn-helix domain-containing protein [Candidatus Wallacebacter cryptica]|jgi:transcriptional regulator with XRE-family HTH domain|nr:helix-turn-helix transcriptional regulator [Bacillota bacterium]